MKALRIAFAVAFVTAFATAPLAAAPKNKAAKPKPSPAASQNPKSVPELVKPADVDPQIKEITERGISAYLSGNFAKSKTAWEEFTQIRGNDATGFANLGIVEFRLGEREEAEKNLKKAVQMAPDASPAWLTLGMLYFNQNKLDGALAALSQATYLEPKSARAHNFLAATIAAKGWRDGAEREFEKAIELDPEYGEAHFNLAVLYLQRVPPAIELARRHYERALELGESSDPLVEKSLSSSKE